MKKTLLLLTLSLACIYVHAQKIDKTLLYGRWELSIMNSEGYIISRDSTTVTIQGYIRRKKEDDPKQKWTVNDSIAAADTAKIMLNAIFKTFVEYGRSGKVKALFVFDKNEYEEMSEDTSAYEWSGENSIILKLRDGHTMTYGIVDLTATKLVMKAVRRDVLMTFTRAK